MCGCRPDRISFNEYQHEAMRTRGAANFVDKIVNGTLGLSGEAGEVADHIKKALFQGHELNKGAIINELGDVMWYIALLADALNVSMEDIAVANIEKLKKRYPNGFSREDSINREE